jgi:hypothetical protein
MFVAGPRRIRTTGSPLNPADQKNARGQNPQGASKMANGATAAALLPIDLEPLTVPVPQFDESLGGIEGWVRALIGAITEVTARALQEFENGEISPETRRLGGDLTARLFELQQISRGKFDFVTVVQQQAQLQLGQRLNTEEIAVVAAWILSTLTRVDAAVQAEMH